MKPCYAKLAGLALISVLAAQSQAGDLIEDQARVLSFQAALTDEKGRPALRASPPTPVKAVVAHPTGRLR